MRYLGNVIMFMKDLCKLQSIIKMHMLAVNCMPKRRGKKHLLSSYRGKEAFHPSQLNCTTAFLLSFG